LGKKPQDETHISGEQQLQILENGRRLLGSPDFGLQLFAQPQPSVHGALNDRNALNSGQKGMMSWQARIDSLRPFAKSGSTPVLLQLVRQKAPVRGEKVIQTAIGK
jgi:hypothetical protein